MCKKVDVESADNVLVRLYTPGSEACVEKTKDQMTIEGNIAIITLNVEEMETFADGCLRYTVFIDNLVADERSSRYYVKTPSNLQPSGSGITKAEVEEMIGDAIEEETGRTESTYQKTLIAGENITIDENNVISSTGGSSSGVTPEEVEEMIGAAIEDETARTESIYLKEASLEGYATEEWVESTYQKILTAGEGVVIENNVISFAGGEISGITEAKAQQMIDASIAIETARTESTYLKEHQSLSGYATEAWVEGKGYQDESDVEALIEAEISDMPTDSEMDSAIEAAIADETARTESTYLKEHQSLDAYYTSAQTASEIADAIATETARTESTYLKEHQSLDAYYTSAQTDSEIADAIATETARTESTYLKEHQSLANYYTKQEIAALNHVSSTTIADIWTGTQAQYDAMTGHTQTTLYIIKD